MTDGAQTPQSPARSFVGWNWRTYLRKTKTGVKWVAGALVTYLMVVIGPVKPPELNQLLAAIVGYGSKVALDVLDYWLSEGPE